MHTQPSIARCIGSPQQQSRTLWNSPEGYGNYLHSLGIATDLYLELVTIDTLIVLHIRNKVPLFAPLGYLLLGTAPLFPSNAHYLYYK